MKYETKILKLNELELFDFRDIRKDLLEKLEERISEHGYNPARPLSVVFQDGKYLVADGNHRLTTAKKLNLEELPCIVYNSDSDPYLLATNGNQDENTYAPMDLFDWLHVIGKLKEEGLTQQKIGDKIGFSREQINQHTTILNKIDTLFLDNCKLIQNGRVSKKDTNVSFDFSEGWFRTSGLYSLEAKYQELCLNDFIQDKCNWNKDKLQRETKKYEQWQDFIKISSNKLVDSSKLDIIIELIENNSFKTEDQLISKINDFNKESKNKLICGDAVKELEKLEDATIDLIITDPPYGIDYTSNHSKYSDYISKKEIKNDDLQSALELLKQTCKILETKTKSDAHLYFFTSWKIYHLVQEIIASSFQIKNLIVWNKMNHSMGDLENTWGNKYELIIFATKGNRKVNVRKADIIEVSRISTTKSNHQTEKPIELISELLSVSALPNDTICDPFMGSGSTIEAIMKNKYLLNYIGIELDREIFEKAKLRI